MKKLLSILMTICSIVFLSACNSSNEENLSEEELLKNKLVGCWCYSVDNSIYSFNVSKEGTGLIKTYVYLKKEWTITDQSFQYTLTGNQITIKPQNEDVMVGTIAITGSNLSFANKDGDAVMLSKYDGTDSKINELKKDIEDNWLESEPGNITPDETFWYDENDLKNALNRLYENTKSFECNQLTLEQIRLTGKNFDNIDVALTPASNEIYEAWQSAYRAIILANSIIGVIDNNKFSSISKEKLNSYRNETMALRCLIYYNVAQLWGHIPYVTKSGIDGEDNVPIYTASEVYNTISSELSLIESLYQETSSHIDIGSVKALLAEVLLCQNKSQDASSLLDSNNADFYIVINSYNDPYLYNIFGEKIINYSSEVIALLKKEISSDVESTISDWKTSKIQWGYWNMLKRVGKAQSISGCNEYELLMPIPQAEIDKNPSLKQNMGY